MIIRISFFLSSLIFAVSGATYFSTTSAKEICGVVTFIRSEPSATSQNWKIYFEDLASVALSGDLISGFATERAKSAVSLATMSMGTNQVFCCTKDNCADGKASLSRRDFFIQQRATLLIVNLIQDSTSAPVGISFQDGSSRQYNRVTASPGRGSSAYLAEKLEQMKNEIFLSIRKHFKDDSFTVKVIGGEAKNLPLDSLDFYLAHFNK